MVGILIIEDHPLFLDALREVVAVAFDAEFLIAPTMNTALRHLDTKNELDIILLDLKVPGSGLFDGLTAIRQKRPDVPVLVISALLSKAVVVEALRYGAAGYIPKSSPAQEITDAIQCILSGTNYLPTAYSGCEVGSKANALETDLIQAFNELTDQQRRVLGLLNTGRLNKQIAHELGIAERTVKAHITGILRKLGINSRTQAALIGERLKELQLLD